MGKQILLFGAGKSATCLIDYLIKEIEANNWKLIVVDGDLFLAQTKIGKGPRAKAVSINVENDADRKGLVKNADLVISLLPPALHFLVADDCVEFEKNLLTASYIDDKIKTFKAAIKSKGSAKKMEWIE